MIKDSAKEHTDRCKLIIASKMTGPALNINCPRGGPRFTVGTLMLRRKERPQRLQVVHFDLYLLHWSGRNVDFVGNPGGQHAGYEYSNPCFWFSDQGLIAANLSVILLFFSRAE